MAVICDEIKSHISELFICEQINEFVRIRTPYLYPDGDVIDLFIKEGEGISTVTDLGETMRWLRGQTVTSKRSPKQRQLIEDVCITHGVELYRGMLSVRVRDIHDLPASIMRAAQASLRIADIWFTYRLRSFENVTDEVAEFLDDQKIQYDRGEKLVGRSGREWTVHFHTRTPQRSALVSVLSTGSRGAARGVVEHNVAAWYDLNRLLVGPEALKFVSLFDDTMDVWTAEDFKLLENLSNITRWSQPDQFRELIAV